jgi:hypothetical protein
MTVSATDANGDSLRFSASNLPVGVIINPWSGVALGSLRRDGTFAPVIAVTDGYGGGDAIVHGDSHRHRRGAFLHARCGWQPCGGSVVCGRSRPRRGTSQYGPRLDGEGHPALDSDGNPIMAWTIARPGEFAIHDARGTSLLSAVFDAPRRHRRLRRRSGERGLWSSGESTNLISHSRRPDGDAGTATAGVD